MNALSDLCMTAAALTFLTGLLTPWHWALAASIALCALGLWLDPETRHQRARQHRREQRAALIAHALTVGARTRDALDALDQAETIINAEADRIMPGLDMEGRWPL